MRRRKSKKRQKRTSTRPPAALSGLLGGLPGSPHVQPRRKLINFLVSETEFEDMHKTAKTLNLTLSSYLRGLHAAAKDALRERRKHGHEQA